MRGLWMIALWATLGTSAAFAQGRIQGVVTDANGGDPLPGANIILVESPTRGASSGVDGSFTIPNVPAGSYTVRATYLGYSSFERRVTVSGQPVTVNIAMTEGDVSLDDFVVTGYGVEIKREVTGASSSVRGDEFAQAPVINAEQALQGRAAGVQITSVSGAPGAGVQIRIRGIGSLGAGTDPLYIIDGVQVRSGSLTTQASGNLLNSLNPNDIESIEVLKDAAAVAIYGAQAANGVVLITTKRGSDGPTRVEFTSTLGSVEQTDQFDILTSPEYARVLVEAAGNRARYLGQAYGLTQKKATLTAQAIDVAAATTDAEVEAIIDGLKTYDWNGEVQRTGARRKADLSIAGGVRNTRFYLSGGAEYQEGQIIKSDFNRLSFRANLDHNPTRRVGISSSVGVTSTQQFGTISDGNFTNGPVFQPSRQRPNDAIYNADGSYNTAVKGGYNIVQGVNLEQRQNRQFQVTGTLRGTYQAMTNLVFSALGGVDVVALRDRNYRPLEIPAFAGTGGSGFEASREALNYNVSATGNYVKVFGKQSLNVLAGTEYKRESQEQFTASATGYPNGLFSTLQSASTPSAVGGFQTEYRTASLFSQAKYDFDNKYFLTGSLRYDGSSRFGENTRFGVFPSVSAAWDISRESFLNVKSIDELKLRASYGITGNSAVSDFASRNLFGRGGAYGGASGLRQTQLGNPDLGWEEAKQFDVALDFSVFNSRIAGSVDYFNKLNDRLLLNRPLQSDAGVTGVNENVGSLRNTGLEFELRTLNFARAGFEWRSDFNISFVQNKIESLLPGRDTLLANNFFVGKPRDVYYTSRFAGINPADGRPMYYDKSGNITYATTAADLTVVGDVVPDYYGGLSNSFSYKGISLSAFLQYNVGQDAFLQQQGFFLWDPSRLDNMERIAVEKAWRKPGDITEFPILVSSTTLPGTSGIYGSSTRLLDDASYLRLKTLTLSYALPRSLLRAVRTRGAQVYFTGNNLVTWTKFVGVDPELVGTAAANYPQSRLYTFGVSLSL